ncbi:hypothetical protein JAAARDRAFT_39515 [Jaapia argillacea MUCL 33604]|uniref:Uncharacterized protein n=1 Tax=Jaapia argillacea MUCL 33604 TaxID=933084 RepID=A0A067PEE7_9AGAM|nr:hypothetical protein JAAARDRAFT_39515 [Jaapia argillacea MUCL 33604]
MHTPLASDKKNLTSSQDGNFSISLGGAPKAVLENKFIIANISGSLPGAGIFIILTVHPLPLRTGTDRGFLSHSSHVAVGDQRGFSGVLCSLN